MAGKQVCSLGVLERGLDRLSVGIGMIPRGEVGLIFANIGLTLRVVGEDGRMHPVVNPAVFGAVAYYLAGEGNPYGGMVAALLLRRAERAVSA